jgi:hypothetical protein
MNGAPLTSLAALPRHPSAGSFDLETGSQAGSQTGSHHNFQHVPNSARSSISTLSRESSVRSLQRRASMSLMGSVDSDTQTQPKFVSTTVKSMNESFSSVRDLGSSSDDEEDVGV